MHQINKQKTFCLSDNNSVDYHCLPPYSSILPSDSPVVIFFNCEKYFTNHIDELITELNLPEYTYFSLDLESGKRSVKPNDGTSIVSYQVYCLQQFITHLSTEYNINQKDIAIISHSENVIVVSSWITDHAPDIRSVVFYSPHFFFKKWDIALFKIKNLLHKKTASHSNVTDYTGDYHSSNISHISWRKLKDYLYSGQRVIRNSFAYFTPTLFILTQADRTRGMNGLLTFYTSIGSSMKSLFMAPDICCSHDMENPKDAIITQVKKFLMTTFSLEEETPSLFDSYRQGVTWNEYEKLRNPETNQLRRIYWAFQKMALKHIGKFSAGIQLGLNTGFDSGASLDYIYRNQAEGSNILGKFIDRYYLKNVGWNCTRMRGKHVEELISLAISRLLEEKKEIKLLDIAAGHGRYIINALEKTHQPIEHLLMRDFDPSNVEKGNQLLSQKKFASVALFEQGDAFSSIDLATLPKDRTLSIVSGLYELFSDNNMVQTSLNGIANATEAGGYIIYTTKLWNPKFAYMARVLVSHKKGEYWHLRRRSQREIDQMVAIAGFEKIEQKIDPWGMFSVVLAKKVA
ncbi:class I SAM-dependent methyltransferase family protein [uncultured Cedecea sp.]|uniref:class I SAM-dependent methyltransferase family protein n=1 Tax=uncultured Cedecea sp. TaxID=988762 RepID=UPI00262C66EB|nr:class I SAM-dependent methyltransferase family protein [uncultured Cedecea sp.]